MRLTDFSTKNSPFTKSFRAEKGVTCRKRLGVGVDSIFLPFPSEYSSSTIGFWGRAKTPKTTRRVGTGSYACCCCCCKNVVYSSKRAWTPAWQPALHTTDNVVDLGRWLKISEFSQRTSKRGTHRNSGNPLAVVHFAPGPSCYGAIKSSQGERIRLVDLTAEPIAGPAAPSPPVTVFVHTAFGRGWIPTRALCACMACAACSTAAGYMHALGTSLHFCGTALQQ